MILESSIRLDAPLGGGADQMNSAARGFRLETQGTIGRALIETKPAVHALIQFGEVKRSDFRLLGVIFLVLSVIQ